MLPIACLANIGRQDVPMFTAVIEAAGAPMPPIVARLDVIELANLKPTLLVCDVDRLEVDPLEMLRQVRFVLPTCIIVVYTTTMKRTWGLECHLAGANGLLLKNSSIAELTAGLLSSLQSGCFTDPRFAAA